MKLGRLTAIMARLALGLITHTGGVGAEEGSRFGINVHAPAGQHLELLFDKVEAAGLGWVRVDFIWAAVEMVPGLYDWRLYDDLVAAARARGLTVLALIAFTPAWATDGPEFSGVPRQVSDWEDFCFRAAERYRGSIDHWEVWNEPNLDHFWDGSRSQYMDLILRPAADAIRAANLEARIGAPALAHLVSGDADWYRWLLDVVEQAGDRLDFVTHHAYDGDGPADVTEKLDANTLFGSTPALWDLVSPSLEEVLREGGWFGRPVWLTETGWDSEAVGEQRQASHYLGLLDRWFTGEESRDWIEKVLFYELEDAPPGLPQFGILRSDASEKPAYEAYRRFVTGLLFSDGFEGGNTSRWSHVAR
jgi:hypothetical protein